MLTNEQKFALYSALVGHNLFITGLLVLVKHFCLKEL